MGCSSGPITPYSVIGVVQEARLAVDGWVRGEGTDSFLRWAPHRVLDLILLDRARGAVGHWAASQDHRGVVRLEVAERAVGGPSAVSLIMMSSCLLVP